MGDFADTAEAIRQLQARYTDAVWRWDFVAFGDLFTEDAEWRLIGRVAKGRAECVGLLQELRANFSQVLFALHPPALEIGDGVATGRTYVTEHMGYADGRPGFSMGIYYDRFVRQDGRWRFALHHYNCTYVGPADMTGRFFAAKDFGPPPAMPGPDEPATPSAEAIFGRQ